jgi:hypothetical protein
VSYVAAAYVAFLALLVVYVAIMARRIGRLERRISSDKEPR